MKIIMITCSWKRVLRRLLVTILFHISEDNETLFQNVAWEKPDFAMQVNSNFNAA